MFINRIVGFININNNDNKVNKQEANHNKHNKKYLITHGREHILIISIDSLVIIHQFTT